MREAPSASASPGVTLAMHQAALARVADLEAAVVRYQRDLADAERQLQEASVARAEELQDCRRR